MRRNHKGLSLPIKAGHSWQQIIQDNQNAFNAHPEYYALVNGIREIKDPISSNPKMCVSNPDVIQICKDWAINYFNQNPNEEMVSMEPSDYNGPDGNCQCTDQDPGGGNCSAIGTGMSSDKVFFLANEVARAVAPLGKYVGLLAYEHHSDIPSFNLETNIYVQLARIFIRGEHPYDQLVDLWPQKAQSVGFYDYWSVFHWSKNRLPSRYGNNMSYLTDMIRGWYNAGGTSLNPEISNAWGINGRGYYLAVKLRWDTQTDVNVLLADFYTKAFGPAASAMQAYYDRLDWGDMTVFTDHTAALAFRDLEAATALAAGHPDVLARLDDLKFYMRYFHLMWMFDREPVFAVKESLALQMLTHAYRTRRSYMMDWSWIGGWWINWINVTEGIGDATWAYGNPTAPWRNDTPYTPAEIDAFFQAGLNYFQPNTNIIEQSFPDVPVAVQFVGFNSDPNAIQQAGYQGDGVFPMTYALHSLAGENLQVRVITATVYPDKPPLFYELYDANGTLITTATVPNGGEHILDIPVPGAGVYYMDVQDNSGGWHIKAHVDTPLGLKVQGESLYHNHQGDNDWYLYVPVGTETVYYYPGNNGYSHSLRGPNNELIAGVNHDGSIKAITVPPGLDGKRWKFYGQIRTLWFYNIPNWVGSSPNALMVPYDVALNDGLTIRGPVTVTTTTSTTTTSTLATTSTTTTSSTTLLTTSTSTSSTTSSTTTTSTTSTTSILTTSTSSTTSPLTGQHDVSFNHNGGYWSSELGDIDPGLSFGHGFLVPGSGNGARFDFWFAPDGVVDGTGAEGGGGASMGHANNATGGDDVFLGSIVMSEDGTDQYQGGTGLDVDSFAFLPGGTVNITGPGYADGTTVGYGRVFESDMPQSGDWYYVGASQVIRDVTAGTVPPNTIPIGRGQGLAGLDPLDGTAWSFQVAGSATPAPPVIADMNKDVTLWSIYDPGGTVTPQYSTNLGTVPVEWLSIPVFSNTPNDGTNVFTFAPPDTNAPLVIFRLQREL